jgi:hypothetical protein
MKRPRNIDEQLLEDARGASRATADTERVRVDPEALVRHVAYESLRALRGRDSGARDVPRRRVLRGDNGGERT